MNNIIQYWNHITLILNDNNHRYADILFDENIFGKLFIIDYCNDYTLTG